MGGETKEMVGKRLVFVESNTTGTGRKMIDWLEHNRIPTLFLARRPSLYPFEYAELDHIEIRAAETNDQAEIVAILEREGSENFSGILTFSEYYVETVAHIAAHFGWPYLSPETAHLCRNKQLLRAHLASLNRSGPSYTLLSDFEDIDRATTSVVFPCVVKPTMESGSLNVQLASNPAELRTIASEILQQAETPRGQIRKPQALVETYLAGPEFSIETLHQGRGIVEVLGIVGKHCSPLPHFVETGHDFPADLCKDQYQRLLDVALRSLADVGYDYGYAHTEIRWNDGDPIVIEINPRLAGGFIPELIGHARDIDLFDTALRLATGKALAFTGTTANIELDGAAIRFLLPTMLRADLSVDHIEQARRSPHVTELAFDWSKYGSKTTATSSYDRMGHIIAAAPTSADAAIAVERALSILTLSE